MKRSHFILTVWITLAVVASTLIGCAGSADKTPKKKQQTVWPTWPDQPRFVFEALLRTEANIVRETEDQAFRRRLTGIEKSDQPIIGKPSGIVAREGRVYLAEPGVKAVTVMDAVRGRLYRFGLREPNALVRPQALALDDEGMVYVLDSGLKRVMVFDALGLFQYSIDVDKGFTNPVAVSAAPDGKTIFVIDRGDLANEDHKVVAFTPDGKEKFRIGPRGQDDGKFNIPLAAAMTKDGTLLIADSGNFRIQAFDLDGKFKYAFGRPGAEVGSFSRPRSIAVDPKGNIYVADAGFNNVQIFSPQGELLMPLGRLSAEPGPGNFSLIGVIAVDETNRLYVTDNLFRKVDVFRHLSDEEGKQMMAKNPKGDY